MYFLSFRAAAAFITDTAQLADSLGHAPDGVTLHGGQVTLTLTTPAAGRVTEPDLALAARLQM